MNTEDENSFSLPANKLLEFASETALNFDWDEFADTVGPCMIPFLVRPDAIEKVPFAVLNLPKLKISELKQFPGEMWILFLFEDSMRDSAAKGTPLRTDGFPLVLEWRKDKPDSTLLSSAFHKLAEQVRRQLDLPGWGLWPAYARYNDKVAFTDAAIFANSDDSRQISSAYGALLAGLLCAASNKYPTFWPFPTLQWDDRAKRIAGVKGLREKFSVAADCGAVAVTVAQDQKREARDILAEMRRGPDGARFRKLSVYAVKHKSNIKRLAEDVAYGASNLRRLIRRIVMAVTIPLCLLSAALGLFVWDINREIVAYYTNVEEIYGVPKGVGELKKEQLMSRYVYYEIRHQGYDRPFSLKRHRMIHDIYVRSANQRQISRLARPYVNYFGFKDGASHISLKYLNGRLKDKIIYDDNNIELKRYSFLDDCTLFALVQERQSFNKLFDIANRPLDMIGFDYRLINVGLHEYENIKSVYIKSVLRNYYVLYSYDDRGLLKKYSFYADSERKKAICDARGVYSCVMDYKQNIEGNVVVTKTYLDYDEKPVPHIKNTIYLNDANVGKDMPSPWPYRGGAEMHMSRDGYITDFITNGERLHFDYENGNLAHVTGEWIFTVVDEKYTYENGRLIQVKDNFDFLGAIARDKTISILGNWECGHHLLRTPNIIESYYQEEDKEGNVYLDICEIISRRFQGGGEFYDVTNSVVREYHYDALKRVTMYDKPFAMKDKRKVRELLRELDGVVFTQYFYDVADNVIWEMQIGYDAKGRIKNIRNGREIDVATISLKDPPQPKTKPNGIACAKTLEYDALARACVEVVNANDQDCVLNSNLQNMGAFLITVQYEDNVAIVKQTGENLTAGVIKYRFDQRGCAESRELFKMSGKRLSVDGSWRTDYVYDASGNCIFEKESHLPDAESLLGIYSAKNYYDNVGYRTQRNVYGKDDNLMWIEKRWKGDQEFIIWYENAFGKPMRPPLFKFAGLNVYKIQANFNQSRKQLTKLLAYHIDNSHVEALFDAFNDESRITNIVYYASDGSRRNGPYGACSQSITYGGLSDLNIDWLDQSEKLVDVKYDDITAASYHYVLGSNTRAFALDNERYLKYIKESAKSKWYEFKNTLPETTSTKKYEHGETAKIILPGGVPLELIYCEPGRDFLYGNKDQKNKSVKMKLNYGFWLGKYEVTQEQWKSVMGTNPSYHKGDKYPVENVSKADCKLFAKKLNGMYNISARLPSEFEWEYACRAGTETKYNFGNCLNGLDANCNGMHPWGFKDGKWVEKGPCLLETASVGSYRPNAWGFFDMHGNVAEFCEEQYGGEKEEWQLSRGGHFLDFASECGSACRSIERKKGSIVCGFRICCSNPCSCDAENR